MSRGRAYQDIRDSEASSRQRTISNKSLSDTEYDVRALSTRPDPSYYGPNFRNFERGRTSTFSQGDRKEPKMPDPYVKRPQPYPPHVAEEYNAYKEYEDNYALARARYDSASPHHAKKSDVDREMKWKEGLPLAREARAAANGTGALRTGFDHKYPYAYESVEAKESHRRQVSQNLDAARRYGRIEGVLDKKIKAEHKARRERYER